MEKEMKILENYIYNKKETMKEQLVKSIEKLIKGYKELESEIHHKNDQLFLMDRENEKYYIPKSKIQEKIEEYNAKGYIEIAGALQQLLEV